MDKKILKWNFIFQYGWVLSNIFNSILLLPLYLKNIDANTLGIWLATTSILNWMTLVDPGIGEVLQQKIAELRGKNETSEIGKSIASGFMASGIILILSVLLGFICYLFVGSLINKNISDYPYLPMALVLSIIATGLSLVSFTMSGINQGMHNTAHVAIASLSANFLFLFVNILFLYLGYGVMSIAFANLCRALYINVWNIISLFHVLKKQGMRVDFQWAHFNKFIRIFSFTSTSKIISGLSYSVDMLVLARFIAPSRITIFEINKRPVNIAYSLIGRHSVALMPLISHAKGKGDKDQIISFINQQFRFYLYAALIAVFLFCLNYEYLITAWTGKGQFAGNTIMFLLVANFFCSLICYFMATVGYALGDIKMNSLYNIIRGIVYGVLIFFGAKNFGIVGTLVVSLAITLLSDFFFYTYRLNKIGYLPPMLLKTFVVRCLLVGSLSGLVGWQLKLLVDKVIPAEMFFNKLLVNSAMFSLFYIILVLIIDREFRNLLIKYTNRYVISKVFKK